MDSKSKIHSNETPPRPAGDSEWERIIAAKRTYPKLEKFAAEALREGTAEPVDPSKLS